MPTLGGFSIGVDAVGEGSVSLELTGPDYPLDPTSDSQGLGQFAIGIGQIGDIVPFSFWSTILVQYANSPIIDQLIGQFQACLDQTQNLSNFYDDMVNIATAQGYGLDCWGRIVGINRVITVSVGGYFGFGEASDALGFNQGIFYNGKNATNNFSLSYQAFRTLIYAKALFNISNGSIQAINYLMMALFPGRGNCYVTDGIAYVPYFGFAEAGNCLPFNQGIFYNGETIPYMSIQYVFMFPLTPVELAIVQTSGVLPKPTGVASSVVVY